MEEFDFVIIGGGLFGVYTALYLADKNYSICIIEKENELLSKASIINQCRLHRGYHYPRSIVTAKMAAEHNERFTSEHKDFINNEYKSYYGIENNSYTNSSQFVRFCDFIQIPTKLIADHPLINYQYLEALFLTEEFSFDVTQIAAFYKVKTNYHSRIKVMLHSAVSSVDINTTHWNLLVEASSNSNQKIKTNVVINASYAGTNPINLLFGIPPLPLEYEIAEIALIQSTPLSAFSLTVIDGPFVSTVPYGKTGMHTLSSVLYTHHHISGEVFPIFDCQKINKSCTPHLVSHCTSCISRPASNNSKMISQLKKYILADIPIDYLHSLFTIKTKLKSSYIDDGRPTEISKLSHAPAFYCLFSGKLNSIYEVEKLLSNEF